MVLGLCAVLAVLSAAYGMFAREAREAVLAAAGAVIAAAGMCFALGSVFVAVVLALIAGALVPAVALAALRIAPAPEPDVRPGKARLTVSAAIAVVTFAALGWLLTATAWPPATGTRDLIAAWLGWRLLTDQILLTVLFGLLIGACGLTAASLLAPRGKRERRASPEGAAR